MFDFFPNYLYVVGTLAVIVSEIVFAILVFKLSRGISYVLWALLIMQVAILYYIQTAPKYIAGASDLGGANLGPNVAYFFGFWITVFVLGGCALAASIFRRIKRQRNNHSSPNYGPNCKR